MHFPIRPFVLASVAGIVIACGFPTAVCGCSLGHSAVYVIGTLADAAGAPVVGARVFLDGFPATLTPSPPIFVGDQNVRTDATGAFRGIAYSYYGTVRMELRVAVLRTESADTSRLNAGEANFRWQRERLDTVRVNLRLP